MNADTFSNFLSVPGQRKKKSDTELTEEDHSPLLATRFLTFAKAAEVIGQHLTPPGPVVVNVIAPELEQMRDSL